MELTTKPDWVPAGLWGACRDIEREAKGDASALNWRLLSDDRLAPTYLRIAPLMADSYGWLALLDACAMAADDVFAAPTVRELRPILLDGYRRIAAAAVELSALVEAVQDLALRSGVQAPVEFGLLPELVERASTGIAEYDEVARRSVEELLRVPPHAMASPSRILAILGEVAAAQLTTPLRGVSPGIEAAIASQKRHPIRGFARALDVRWKQYPALAAIHLSHTEVGALARVVLDEPRTQGLLTAEEVAALATEAVRGARRGASAAGEVGGRFCPGHDGEIAGCEEHLDSQKIGALARRLGCE